MLDDSRADLEELLHLAGRAAFHRTLGEVLGSDIMSRPSFAMAVWMTLKDAWALMRTEQIKLWPVISEKRWCPVW